MKNWRQTFASRLKKARINLNLSQKSLATYLGISDKSISAYEKGRVLPPTDLLPKISRKLNISISYLFGEDMDLSIIKIQLENLEKGFFDVKKKLETMVKK